ncbi:transmembrane protein [Thraustotheca clavata]|uniref:Transmembrane protein n=1 Tax=Thraustotheca clavata TaxID=74557 RepID=A0A1V9ZY35_9STRA|nr:transmembrane protein [Thraustotheca clavata]
MRLLPKHGFFHAKASAIPIMEEDSEPSPLPIYMDMQTARHIGGTRATHSPSEDVLLDNVLFDTLQLQTMVQRRRRMPKEMRLLFEAEQEILRSPTAQRQSGVVVQPENLWRTYDTVSRYHFERNGGALRTDQGDPLPLVSKACFGLFANVLTVGFLYGVLPSLYLAKSTKFEQDYTQLPVATLMAPLYPIFNASIGFTLLPASLRIFVGFISDYYPFLGYHRKTYMIAGWIIAMLSFLCTGMLAVSNQGSSLLIPLLIATFGITIADVVGDARMVEFAQRERLRKRGYLQSLYVGIKFGMAAGGQLYSALFRYYQPTPTWTDDIVSYQTLLFTLSIICVVPIPCIWFRLVEEKTTKSCTLRDWFSCLFDLLKKKSIAQILLFQFAFSLFSQVGYGCGSLWKRQNVDLVFETTYLMQNQSAVVDPVAFSKSLIFTQSLMISGGLLCFALPMLLCRGPLSAWNWRVSFFSCTVIISLMGATQSSFLAYDTSRGPVVWYMIPLIFQFPMGIRFLTSLFPIVEVTERDYEATLYSLLFTAQLVPLPISTMFFSLIEAPHRSRLTILNFTSQVTQDDVGQLTSYGALLSFAVLLSLCWLPNQKVSTQVLRKFGGSHHLRGKITLVVVWISITLLITLAILSLTPSVGCLTVLGDKCPTS